MYNNGRPSLIDPLNDPRWDPFVSSHRYGSIYQHSSWLRVIKLSYKQLEPLALVLEDGGSILSALPFCIVRSRVTGNRLVSLPFTSYCDPLVSSKGDFSRLLDTALDFVAPPGLSRYYELRVFHAREEVQDPRLKTHSYHKIHILDLRKGLERVKQSFHKDCIRKSIQKAVRSGITVRVATSEQDLKTYYAMHGQTRRRLGLPIQPYGFFKNMWAVMKPLNYFTLLLAQVDDRVIGGIVVFKFRDTLSMEHIGTDINYLLLRPNHLLYSKAIEMACDEGCLYADFGKTTPENQGLLDFKRRWGAEMYEVPYFYYPEIKGMMALEEKNTKYKALVCIGRYMPLALSRFWGSVAYRHMG